ncbi:MAG: outer membrane protein [Devosia sp.]|jgi:outer membrane immunogenic protein
MSLFNKLILAGLISAIPVAAHATDLLTSGSTLPVASSGFDWNRFYAGVYGVGQDSGAGGQFGAGVDLGVNARLEFVLVGAEVRVEGLDGGAGMTGYAQGLGKAGIALTDSAILYGAGGIGASFSGPSESDGLLGGGVELALTDNVSVDARYLHGFPITGANPKDQVTVGANFHF